jgi:NTP pyrophosphatase (non-canonical NTP hydrolase)
MTKVSIRDFQNLMITLYGERDKKRGIEKSLIWLQTELGELLKAFLENDQETIQEEVADIFAWLCSVCNLLNVDLEKAAWKKYPNACPKCESNPCKCYLF